MRLASIRTDEGLRSAIVIGEMAIDVGGLAERIDVARAVGETVAGWNRRLIGDPDLAAAMHAAAAALDAGDPLVAPLDRHPLGPPVPDPEKIICLGLNYVDHAGEAKMELPEVPAFFSKFANSLAGPEDDVRLPTNSDSVDYEGELAVVIGRCAKDVGPEEANGCVGGYTVIDDISCRDLQMQGTQWQPGKIQDGFAPMGPWLVTADEIPDPTALRLQTRRNGVLVQDASIGSMVFSIPEAISYLSTLLTLNPGDVIATGTPSGVVFGQEGGEYLRAGDVVEVEIEGIGRLRNSFA
jgi:acylpyruvate hydrolase